LVLTLNEIYAVCDSIFVSVVGKEKYSKFMNTETKSFDFFNSIDIIDSILKIEKEFNVYFPDVEVSKIDTRDKLCNSIMNKLCESI
jgi:acyl carrier protein